MPVNPEKQLADEIGRDLRVLGQIISSYQLSINGNRALETASYRLRQQAKGTEILSIQLADFDLRIGGKQRFKPPDFELEERLLTDILLEQDLALAVADRSIDSILRNAVTLKIKGISDHRQRRRVVVSAWHFDQHSYGSTQTTACHPTYHWQFGGWGLKEVSDSIGGVLVMDTPRLFAPPLDAVLAVDFLLSHFNGPGWQAIRTQDPRYTEIVRRSQSRLWKPYFDELAEHISSAGSSPSNHFGKLLPNII